MATNRLDTRGGGGSWQLSPSYDDINSRAKQHPP
jgi:hypothetical protein